MTPVAFLALFGATLLPASAGAPEGSRLRGGLVVAGWFVLMVAGLWWWLR